VADDNAKGRGPALLGAAAATCVVAMVGGMLLALLALMEGDWVGAGACLTAAGATAGLVLNAYVRR